MNQPKCEVCGATCGNYAYGIDGRMTMLCAACWAHLAQEIYDVVRLLASKPFSEFLVGSKTIHANRQGNQ